jgi:hypothetical protein
MVPPSLKFPAFQASVSNNYDMNCASNKGIGLIDASQRMKNGNSRAGREGGLDSCDPHHQPETSPSPRRENNQHLDFYGK